MVLENTKCSEVIHKEFKKCEFCGKELTPQGLDYLYANISPDAIKYERCDCYKAQSHWKKLDEEEYKIERLIVAGGVSANGYLRQELQKLCDEVNVELTIHPMKYCTDNATMIACAAYPQFLNKEFSDLSLRAKSQEYFFQNKD